MGSLRRSPAHGRSYAGRHLTPALNPLPASGRIGVDIHSDMTKFEDLRTRAEAGDAGAQCKLGVSYANGRGVEQDDVEALRWIRLAADQGHAASQCFLGARYATGEGVTQDDTEALRWTRLAAEQGVSSAQYNLGLMHASGGGVPEDYVSAYVWWSVAKVRGNEQAATKLKILEPLMSERDILEARSRADEWWNQHQ